MTSLEPHTLSTSQLSLSLLPYGLTFSSLLVKVPSAVESSNYSTSTSTSTSSIVSEQRDVLIGPRDLKDHLKSRNFLNQIVGRYANRLPSGRLEVEVEGFDEEGLVLNLERTEGKDVCLHGGRIGIDKVDWDLVATSNSKLFKEKEPSSSSTIYRHLSPHGADGFPGNLLIEAFVGLSEPNEREGTHVAGRLEVVLRAKIVEEEGEGEGEGMKVDATPVNLTIHWGFGGFDGREEKDVKEYDLWIAGDRTPELHPNMLPTGKILQLSKEDPLNFSSSRKIGTNFPENGIGQVLFFITTTSQSDPPLLKKNLIIPPFCHLLKTQTDHNFLFNSTSPTTPKVILISPDGRLGLEFRTNQSSVQCYTAFGFDGLSPIKKELHGRKAEGRGYDQFGATFLEFHQPIATFLHQELKEIVGGDTILRRGEVYENWCEVTFKIK